MQMTFNKTHPKTMLSYAAVLGAILMAPGISFAAPVRSTCSLR